MALGEWARKRADLEHWAAFEQGFRDVAEIVLEVAAGRRGRAPRTITFLSGDVHHSYVAEAWPRDGVVASRILQAVCSPIRNPLPQGMRGFTALAAERATGRGRRGCSRWPGGCRPSRSAGRSRRGLGTTTTWRSSSSRPAGIRMWWNAGEVVDGVPDGRS